MIDVAKDELIEIRAVASKLNRKYDTVMTWIRSCRLPAKKIGGTWYTTQKL